MPSLEDSRRQVQATIADELDHDAILASLQDEIDKHNAVKDELRDDLRRSGKSKSERQPSEERFATKSSAKFRFKHGIQDPRDERKKRHRSRRTTDDEGEEGNHARSKHKRKKRSDYPTPSEEEAEEETAHPFPREPADPTSNDPDAFRASLFDALADDEGSAAYWESVYNQPIHIYPRPTVEDARTGKLEQMSDEEYVRYVKEKMWERKNPEIVYERKRKESERKKEEEEKTKRREEFVRRKERKAWEDAQRWTGRAGEEEGGDCDEGYEYAFAGEGNRSTSRSDALESEYTSAWTAYLNAWHALLTTTDPPTKKNISKTIPWPVLTGKPAIKSNIEAFMQRAPAGESGAAGRLKALKAERLRWHPDKIQQRFGGEVDEGTMKLVTGVFQVVDGIVKGMEGNG